MAMSFLNSEYCCWRCIITFSRCWKQWDRCSLHLHSKRTTIAGKKLELCNPLGSITINRIINHTKNGSSIWLFFSFSLLSPFYQCKFFSALQCMFLSSAFVIVYIKIYKHTIIEMVSFLWDIFNLEFHEGFVMATCSMKLSLTRSEMKLRIFREFDFRLSNASNNAWN